MHARALRLFLLVVALLSGQLGGLSHAACHVGQDQDVPHAACELCGAYSAFGHGLAGIPPAVPAAAAMPAAMPIAPVSRPLRHHFQFHSRAPPNLV